MLQVLKLSLLDTTSRAICKKLAKMNCLNVQDVQRELTTLTYYFQQEQNNQQRRRNRRLLINFRKP